MPATKIVPVPTLYTRDDTEGLYTRYAVACKRVAFRDVVVVGDSPPELASINPHDIFPFLVDRSLALCGAALGEYMNERHPTPALLPTDPIARAQVRMLTDSIKQAFTGADAALPEAILRVEEVEECYDPEFFFFVRGGHLTILDNAVVALLHTCQQNGLWNSVGSPLRHYYERLSNSRAFQEALPLNIFPPVEYGHVVVA